MWVFDFEVFKYDWLVVIENITTDQCFNIVNSREQLLEFYNEHKKELLVGYNNKRYDDYIFKGILLGENPKYLNDIIIEEGNIMKLWNLFDLNKYPLATLDISQNSLMTSLKQNEGWLGLDIEESSVPFDIDRQLTNDEIEDVLYYCRHDVKATKSLFMKHLPSIKTKFELVKKYNLSMYDLKKTNAQLTAKILKADKINEYEDEYDPYVAPKELQLGRYGYILDFYTNPKDGKLNYEDELVVDIAGVEHTLKFGGLHGARKSYRSSGEDKLWLMDVSSYYPSLMYYLGYMSRGIPKSERETFKDIYDTKFRLSAEGRSSETKSQKLILNTIYGCMKNKYNGLYDPRMVNNVCITGQLLLIDLIDKVEDYATLIQSNTDGIIIIPNDEAKVLEAMKEWSIRTKMPIEPEIVKALYQKDVNNYIMINEDDSITLKGAMVSQSKYGKSNNPNKNSKSIVDDCVVNYFVNGISPERTVYECNDLMKYQIITKTGKSYAKTVWETPFGDKEVQNVNRVYATKQKQYGKLYKCKEREIGFSREQLANLPDHCMLDNRNNFDIKYLDKQYYINEAKDRIKMFKE